MPIPYSKFLFFILPLLVLSCHNESGTGNSERTIPKSNGGRMDIIVVADESLWQSAVGDLFRKYFTAAQAGLPQAEPIFTVRQIEPENFSNLLQRSRNLILLEEGKTVYRLERNKWAKPQIVISLAAKNKASLVRLISKKQKEMIAEIKEQEIKVLQEKMEGALRPNPQVLSKHNVSMEIPRAFELEKEQENLLVFWNKTLKTDQGLIIYFKPMPENMGAVGEDVISMRDSLTEIYIQAEREGGYMITEDMIDPVYRNTEIGGQFALEVRGLWRTTNTFMGGSFINYTVYDERNQQIIFMDAFVYSPETKKRNFVLELEAILRSLEIVD